MKLVLHIKKYPLGQIGVPAKTFHRELIFILIIDISERKTDEYNNTIPERDADLL